MRGAPYKRPIRATRRRSAENPFGIFSPTSYHGESPP